jgi:hypothetical protein
MPYQIIYSSQASHPMTATDLESILADARVGNEAHGITGALVYVDNVFLQILEGEEGALRGLMASIANDTRHHSIKVFHEAEIDAPAFGNWRMAYLSSTPESLSAWAGLPGTATLESILEEIDRHPGRASQMAGRILKALAD